MTTVVVTGADMGLGLALVHRFLETGARVFAGRYGADHGLLRAQQTHGQRLGMVDLDVTDMASIRNAAAALAAKTDSVDILINNAGGVFASHPRPGVFTVYPVTGQHPITDGIDAFTVDDELYIQTHQPNVELHLVTLHQNVARPVVWSKHEGDGRVAHVALGHSQAVWGAAPYQRLMLQTLAWLTGGGGAARARSGS